MNKFVVSCQALENEPLHSPFIMGRMAKAALEGGAEGIRANSVEDIAEIKQCVSVPIIGIIKQDYEDSEIFITPTIKEIDALVSAGVEVIATDATLRPRPDGVSLNQFYAEVRRKYPSQKLMADCSNFEEMRNADKLGFDYISTTLFGYTPSSHQNAFVDIGKLVEETKSIKAKLVAEGQISTPEMATEVAKLKIFDVIVIGSAITRPQLITRGFYEGIKYEEDKSQF